ncbi:FHA domain-containing protein [Photobacterium sp. SDRW27]|uniref:type VI secretion system-associated FHA domain protein n=1 Tax=Photobacterium obscurum TaxID=2829490 RepID=UPI0022437273|nr:FHA domain-containing protein [Photobacterium obscurum]MCW8327877.1 FHA domain-containing protein [Photobacterium obscurum]
MPLSLRIISSPDGEPISEWTKNFPEEGGSIGRSYGTTMQLSDASRAISGTHAIINRGSRGYQVMDVSTNGLFINGNHQPLGKNNSSSLNDGDVLDLGHYRLMVSCFVPERATIKPSFPAQSASLGEWADDPFGGELPVLDKHAEPEVVRQTHADELSFSAISEPAMSGGVVDLDPFGDLEPEVLPQLESVHVDRFNGDSFNEGSFDDDPFATEASDSFAAELVSNRLQPVPLQRDIAEPISISSGVATGIDAQQIITMQAKQQELMTQAVEMAFGRLMDEMAPSHLEGMFNDLIQPGFFSRKPDYWEMYKRYFQRQQDNQEWQLKFKAYFSESLRIKQSLGEK